MSLCQMARHTSSCSPARSKGRSCSLVGCSFGPRLATKRDTLGRACSSWLSSGPRRFSLEADKVSSDAVLRRRALVSDAVVVVHLPSLARPASSVMPREKEDCKVDDGSKCDESPLLVFSLYLEYDGLFSGAGVRRRVLGLDKMSRDSPVGSGDGASDKTAAWCAVSGAETVSEALGAI